MFYELYKCRNMYIFRVINNKKLNYIGKKFVDII